VIPITTVNTVMPDSMNPVPSPTPPGLIPSLMAYLRPVVWHDIAGIVCLLLYSYFAIWVPAYVKTVINQIEQGTTRHELLVSCLLILVLAAGAGFMLFLARWLIIGASREFDQALRNDFFAHIQRLSPGFYHRIRTGDLMTRFTSDIEQVRMLVGPGIMYPTQTIFMTTLALYSMFQLDTGLTLTLLAPITFLLLYVNFNTRKLHQIYRQSQDIYSELTAKAQENFSGIRIIKAYCQEETEITRFRAINERYVRKNMEQVKLRGLLFPFMQFIGGLGVVLILWRGGLKVIADELKLGDLVQFALYYQMLMWPIIAMGWIINVIHRGVASWRRLQGILATQPEVEEIPEASDSPPLGGAIEARRLTFAYDPNSPPVLQDVSFKVEPGQTLAIVGPTGCGKTTIVNLLLHLYPVPDGMLFYDGRDINEIPLAALRRSIAYVSQDVFLFSDTIRNNILFGAAGPDEIPDEAMTAAAARAQLSRDLAMLPDQYETEVGERGITLSGGQKQRTGIARALVLQRPLLILDDSLSSVDTDTEEAILRGIAGDIHRSTAILISHRISTVKNADHIIVLDEGRIVEEGTHEALIDRGGLYARIYRRQLLEESLGIRH